MTSRSVFARAQTQIHTSWRRYAEATPSRGLLIGVLISGIFGIVWFEWAASGLSGGGAGVVRTVGVVLGVVIIGRSIRLRRSVPIGRQSMFKSRAYWLVVASELGALAAGNAVLGVGGEAGYRAAWVAFIVGVHFLAFGRCFHVAFYWLGTAVLLSAIAGLLVGLAGGGTHGIEVATGLISGTSLFASGLTRVFNRKAGTFGASL